MNITVVNICGALNSGDHTQLVSFLKILKEAHPESDITCVHRNPDLHRRLIPQVRWAEAIGTDHSMNFLLRRMGNLRGVLPAFLHLQPLLSRSQSETYKLLRDADLTIAHPGGYFGNPGPSIYSALLHMSLARRGQLAAVSQSIGPFKSSAAKRLTRRVMQNAALFTVREPCSLAYVMDEWQFTQQQVQLLPDVAFYERGVDDDAARQALGKLGINSSDRLAATTFWPSSKRGVPESGYFEILGLAAKTLNQRHGIRTIALRQRGDAEGIEGDTSLLRQASRYFGDAGIMAYDYFAPEVVRGIVKRCEVTYGTRMHANVFSLGQCVPTVAISYNHKTDGIMRMCGQDGLVLDLTRLALGPLLQRLESALQNANTIRQSLKDCMARFQHSRAGLVGSLRALCRER